MAIHESPWIDLTWVDSNRLVWPNPYVAVHTRRFESIQITAIHGDSESMIGLDLFFHQSRRVSRPYETTYDHIWPHTNTYDHIRPHTNTYEHIWPHMTTYDHIRPHMTTYDHIRPHAKTCDQIRPHTTTWGHIRPLYDHLRTYTVLFRVIDQIWEQMSKATKFRSSRINWMHP